MKLNMHFVAVLSVLALPALATAADEGKGALRVIELAAANAPEVRLSTTRTAGES